MRIIYLIFAVFFALCSCSKQQQEKSPSQRNKENIEHLRNELVQAPYGWKMIYFSKSDSLLFSDKDQVLENLGRIEDFYGYGGHYFLLKFSEEGSVQMLADYDNQTATTPLESEFEVKQNSFTQLSFTTYNYLHRIVNEKFKGASDFLYVGKNFQNKLVFKTAQSLEYAREYIVLEKLTSAEQWDGAENFVKKSYENRVFFDEMKNPQLTIRQGARVFFQSDIFLKTDSPLPSYQRFLREIKNQRYYLFRFNKVPDPVYPENAKESTGLGSGYVGTETGLRFYSGLRFNSTYIFYDFERKEGKFVCELVKIYDPILRKQIYVSKHLFPEGEPTHFVAEIEDMPVNR